jgi:hypothetical protein
MVDPLMVDPCCRPPDHRLRARHQPGSPTNESNDQRITDQRITYQRITYRRITYQRINHQRTDQRS